MPDIAERLNVIRLADAVITAKGSCEQNDNQGKGMSGFDSGYRTVPHGWHPTTQNHSQERALTWPKNWISTKTISIS